MHFYAVLRQLETEEAAGMPLRFPQSLRSVGAARRLPLP